MVNRFVRVKKLTLPYAPSEEDEEDIGQEYELHTASERLVSTYAGLSIPETRELDVLNFLLLRREAYISALRQTEKGREYLQQAWLREQTTADRSALRKVVGEVNRK